MAVDQRLARALAAIDQINAGDPNTLVVRGVARPKALGEAELASEWIERLVPTPSDELVIATRAHHLRRWEIPRATYPDGRAGYLRWKSDLHRHHVAAVGEVLSVAGYDAEVIARVQDIVRKKGINRQPDDEVQALEDALALVFIETQYADLEAKVADPVKMADIVDKTLAKMSEAGRTHAALLMG